MNWSGYENFSEAEFTCQCGCGQTKMQPQFLDWLQQVRTTLRAPMTISSGYRCADHNDAVSSTGREGPHTTGWSCDVLVHGPAAHRLLRTACAFGARGVGVSQKGEHAKRFLHLDMLPQPLRPWVWSY